MLIELRVFALGVMAEALRAIIDQKSAIVKVVGQFQPIFLRSMGRPPRTIFAQIDRPVNALQPCR